MKVVLTIPSMAKANGGPVAVVRDLADHLTNIGCEVVIGTIPLSKSVEEWLPRSSAVQVIRIGAEGDTNVSAFLRDFQPEVVHDFGLWLPANHRVAKHTIQSNIPLIISPCGMLNPWARQHKKWKKKFAWYLYQKRDLQSASLLVATAAEEARHIANCQLGRPIEVVPNGIDIHENSRLRVTALEKKCRTVLFMGRIHPVKGLINLVEAWAKVAPVGWRCKIAGPDEKGHRAEVEASVRKYKLESSFELIGPVDGDQKLSVLRDADLFVLPSFTENFGIAAAEAMAEGVPVITTVNTPWKGIRDKNCGWWIEIGVDPLVDALREATSLSVDELTDKGRRSRHYVHSRYAWPQVAVQMKEVYQKVLR